MASILNPTKVPFTGPDGKITREWFIFLTNLLNNSAAGTVTAVTGGNGITVSNPNTTPQVSLVPSGVTPGAYTSANITVDLFGRITVADNGTGGGLVNPMTSVGDIIVGAAAGAPARLAATTDGQVLTLAGGTPTWATASGGLTASQVQAIIQLPNQF